MGEERVLGALENHRLNVASFRQARCAGLLPSRRTVSGNSLTLPALGAACELRGWVSVARSPN